MALTPLKNPCGYRIIEGVRVALTLELRQRHVVAVEVDTMSTHRKGIVIFRVLMYDESAMSGGGW